MALVVAASLGSIAVNIGRVAPLAAAVLKGVTLVLSFIIFFYFVSSVVTSVASVVVVTKFLVSGVAVVAFFAIVEQRTGFNVFDHLRSVLPFLQFEGSITGARFGLIRAAGSADHPIALGVLFAMIAFRPASLWRGHCPPSGGYPRSLRSSASWRLLRGRRSWRSSPPRSSSCGFGPVTSFLSYPWPSPW